MLRNTLDFNINSDFITFKHIDHNNLIYNELQFQHTLAKYIYVKKDQIHIEKTLNEDEIEIVKTFVINNKKYDYKLENCLLLAELAK